MLSRLKYPKCSLLILFASENWQVGFADYPPGEDVFYELGSELTTLPSYLGTNVPGLKITGNNHSDDLFMFAKKNITGLKPNTTYDVTFELEIATNASSECFGVGGAPGVGVYIKTGISVIEPNVVEDVNNNILLMNINKGNQAQSGTDAIVLGHFGNTNPCENITYQLKILDNHNSAVRFTTNNSGNSWILVGTDSAFEATTTIYYKALVVRLSEVK